MDIKYIATIHTQRGSYRMATGYNGWLQNEISRMFEVASVCHVPTKTFNEILEILVVEDDKCEMLDYHRYDCVEPTEVVTNLNIEEIHRLMHEKIVNVLGKYQFSRMYREVLLICLHYQVKELQHGNRNRYSVYNSDVMLFQFDRDKVAAIVIITDIDDFVNIKKLQDEVLNEAGKRMPSLKIFPIFLYAVVESCDSELLLSPDFFVLRFDDLILLLNQDRLELKDIYLYWDDRKTVAEKIQGSEIDIFCSYWNNMHTFYSNTPSFKPEIGRPDLYGKMKCDWEQTRDLHLINAPWGACMVSRFADFHQYLPLYRPASSKGQEILVCQYTDSQVMMITDCNDKDKQIVYQEIVKSLLVWMLVIETRFKTPLLHGDLVIRLRISPKNHFEVLYNKEFFIFGVPEEALFDKTLSPHLEPTLLKNLLDGLSHFGIEVANDYLDRIRTVFGECKGHILQLSQSPDILMWQDGVRTSYDVNECWADRVLADIAEFIDMKGADTLLSVEESGRIGSKIQDYLIESIYTILKDNAGEKLLRYLLRLEHGLLFWLKTSHGRYEGIESVMEYMGVEFVNQKAYIDQYLRASNLTRLFIERLIKNDYPESNRDMTEEDFDHLFALGHQYFNISMYLDVLNVEGESARLSILSNGRIAYPMDCLDKGQEYMKDLCTHELEELSKHLRIVREIPEYALDTSCSEFKEAFMAEYNIPYENYKNIWTSCITHAVDNGSIVVMPETIFMLKFLSGNNGKYSSFKKHFILSKKAAKKLEYSDFAVQRNNRAFQVTTRPWILYNGNIFFSFKVLYRHWEILCDRIERGRLRAHSDLMKSFIGRINKSRGNLFNNALCELYKQQNAVYLQVFKNVKIAEGETLNAQSEDIGDIDLLIVDTRDKRIICAELKNYKESRSVFELYDQVQKTKEDLEKVLKRDAWCKQNVGQFKKICKEVDESYKVQTIFLTYNMQAIRYHSNGQYPQIKFLEMRELIDNPLKILE